MVKRIAIALLWFYVVCVGSNVVAYLMGLSLFLVPVVAAGVAAFVAGDPMHRIWPTRDSSERISKQVQSTSQ